MSWCSLLEITSRDQVSELSSATMVIQMTVVADLIRSEDELSLLPNYTAGNCPACRFLRVHMGHKRL